MAMTASTPIISINVKPCVRRLTADLLTEFIFMVLCPLLRGVYFLFFVFVFLFSLRAADFPTAISNIFTSNCLPQQFALLRDWLSRSFVRLLSVALRWIWGEWRQIRGEMALAGANAAARSTDCKLRPAG
jgi:hypothetical protein